MLEPSRVLEMLGGAQDTGDLFKRVEGRASEEYYDVIDERFLGEERFVEKIKV